MARTYYEHKKCGYQTYRKPKAVAYGSNELYGRCPVCKEYSSQWDKIKEGV